MHIQKDYYICDHCKSEIPDNAVREVTIPVEEKCQHTHKTVPMKLDLCKECRDELTHVIAKHFHRFSYSYILGYVDEEGNEDE